MSLISRATGANEEESVSEQNEKSRKMKILQGAIVFVVMFAVLWTLLSRVTDDE